METRANGMEPRWLVFGASGQVGHAFLAARRVDDPPLLAVSRNPPTPGDTVQWLQGALPALPLPDAPLAGIASLGPLDAFVDWYERTGARAPVVVALGSTSVHGKRASPEPVEAGLALRLADCERRLLAAAAARGGRATVLRPTLVWGAGRDRNLTRLVGLARRWHVLPLPRGARGLRQPVHVDDLAAAVLACLRDPARGGGAFDLPGGETLPFDEMVSRTLRVAAPRARLVRVPDALFRTAVRALRVARVLDGAGEGLLSRLGQDLAYDPEPARVALGWNPAPFRPEPAMFPG